MQDVVVVDTMGGLGDLLLAMPLIEAVARSHPEARLTVATTAPWHALLEHDPRVHVLVPVPGRDAATIRATVGPLLERLRPDLAITTNRQHGLPELLSRTATRAITDLWRHPPVDEPVDLRMLRLLIEEGVVDPAHERLAARVVLRDAERVDGRGILDALTAGPAALLLPDSGMAVKQWPLPSWTAVANGLRQRGRTPVVVSQIDGQRDVLAAAGALVVPPLPVRGLAALMAAAGERGGVAVGGDTGPVRLAAAVGLPVVGLFGPTAAARYGYRERALNLQGLPDCPVRRPTAITEQECWWTGRCPLTADHAPACLADIAPDAVVAAALRV